MKEVNSKPPLRTCGRRRTWTKDLLHSINKSSCTDLLLLLVCSANCSVQITKQSMRCDPPYHISYLHSRFLSHFNNPQASVLASLTYQYSRPSNFCCQGKEKKKLPELTLSTTMQEMTHHFIFQTFFYCKFFANICMVITKKYQRKFQSIQFQNHNLQKNK